MRRWKKKKKKQEKERMREREEGREKNRNSFNFVARPFKESIHMEFLAISGLYRSADAANDTPLSLRSPYVTPSDANKNLTAFTVERHQKR